MKIAKYLAVACLAFQSSNIVLAQQRTLTVQVDKPTAEVNQNMWGLFFEDINMGADGGIYAELVKNRSFEFFRPLMGWKNLGTVHEADFLILNRQNGHEANPRFLRVNTTKSHVEGTAIGIQNEGFRGMGLKEGLSYDFSLMYRQSASGITLRVELLDSTDQVIGMERLKPANVGEGWHYQSLTIHSSKTTPKGKLNVWFEGSGEIDLDMISLFPEDTWKGRPKGLRADMVQALADINPGFLRFPGGCIVEGFDLSQRFQWKKTVGPIEDRQMIINRWNFEFAHRMTPDYFQTFGLGFFEYFQLSEDIGAEPLPILNCGMACQFNTGELVPLNELDEYVQDALDLIEFANGGIHTKWGKLRADMGHPEPFDLKMIGIGNENWGPQYIERLAVFKKILNQKHPEIAIVASSGTGPDGDRFDYLNKELRAMNVDIIDEHFYRDPEWFLTNAARYDDYDRNGPKVFAGEYASHTKREVKPENKNNWEAALSEAAFLTGLERNADVVHLASYAPLFAHVDGWQWTPDLIWVDNLEVYVTPSYHVQKLYANNKGTHVVPLQEKGRALTGENGYYASAVVDKNSKELIVKIVNTTDKKEEIVLDIQGVKKIANQATHILLRDDDILTTNAVGKPATIAPEEVELKVKGKKAVLAVQPNAFHLLKFKM